MENPAAERNEPLTPMGRLFLRPKMDQIIHGIIGTANPIDVESIKSVIKASPMVKHPRFSSLLVTDCYGHEHWRRTEIDIDSHVIVVWEPKGEGDGEDAANDYVADLAVSSPLHVDKPLWEVHILMAHNCIVVRIHHALGDCTSLMSLLRSLCRNTEDPTRPAILKFTDVTSAKQRSQGRKGKGMGDKVMRFVKVVWYTLLFVSEFLLRCLWVSDRKTSLSGGDGVELWPRKLVTARFRLEDLKAVKWAAGGATINDVLFGVICYGLSKYLDVRTPYGHRMTGLAMVNLRKQPGLQDLEILMNGKSGTRWGNKFGMMHLPVYYLEPGSDPLQYVKRAKSMLDKKKLSLEAQFSNLGYKLVISTLGAKVASWFTYRMVRKTTFLISNVVGPQEDITVAGNPIKYLRVTISALPSAITMHFLSYAGRADMQILVAKDIVPDPQVLAKCFEDALLEMKEAVEALNKAHCSKNSILVTISPA